MLMYFLTLTNKAYLKQGLTRKNHLNKKGFNKISKKQLCSAINSKMTRKSLPCSKLLEFYLNRSLLLQNQTLTNRLIEHKMLNRQQ